MSLKIDLHYPERTNLAWIHDNNRTILPSDGQIASLPSSDIVKLEPQSNIWHDGIQDPVTPKTSNADRLSLVLTEEHTAETNDRPKRLRTHSHKDQAGFAWVNLKGMWWSQRHLLLFGK